MHKNERTEVGLLTDSKSNFQEHNQMAEGIKKVGALNLVFIKNIAMNLGSLTKLKTSPKTFNDKVVATSELL